MKNYQNCRWYACFVNACTNGESKHLADFVPEDGKCEKWEAVKNE